MICVEREIGDVPCVLFMNNVTIFQRLDMRRNYIGKLSNDSFAMYPHIKILLLSFNQLRAIEAGSLAVLVGLETLDLAHNVLKEVPAGLPGSLVALYLDGNPLTDIRNLDRAAGLRVLGLNRGRLDEYPRPGLVPNLVELDLSDNYRIAELDPVRLAGTCRLTKLNVTDIEMFPGRLPGSHCRCRRLVQWAVAHNVLLVGMDPCPKPLDENDDYDDDHHHDDRCAGPPDEARAVYDTCMDVRGTPYRAKLVGAASVVVVVVAAGSLALCVCRWLRRRAANGTADTAAERPNSESARDGNGKTERVAAVRRPSLVSYDVVVCVCTPE